MINRSATMPVIFDSRNYKDFLHQYISAHSMKKRGFKSTLSQAMGCQTSYLSQVLHGDAHINLEQGDKLAQHLKLSPQETEYLFLMIQYYRAGSPSLKRYFNHKIDEILKERMVLKNRVSLGSIKAMSQEDHSRYYSNWIYSAIHIILTIPEFRKVKNIAKRLQLSEGLVQSVLDFLVINGLAVEKNEEYTSIQNKVHLGSDSVMVAHHHSNWRMNTLRSLELNAQSRDNLHYSSVVSMSKSDAMKIQEKMIREISIATETIKNSPEEELFGFHLDLYKI